MERVVGPLQRQSTQNERISEVSRLLQEAQRICRSTDTQSEQGDRQTRQLFIKIATLLDDVIAILARHERQQPPPRTLH